MMNRKAILAPMLALTILLLTPSLLFTVIGDGVENYVIISWGHLEVINSAGVRNVIYHFSPEIALDVAIDSSGNYIVCEGDPTDVLSKVTPSGERTVIYQFSTGTSPMSVEIDSSGNYIVAEANRDLLSKITPDGVRTVICNFPAGSGLGGLVIDHSGNYIVCEFDNGVLSKVTPGGMRTVIYEHTGFGPGDVDVDSSGNYIVPDQGTDALLKITPASEMTVVYNFSPGTNPLGIAVDSSGNYIVYEINTDTLSKITPTGERTEIYKYPSIVYGGRVYISTAPQLSFTVISDNGLTATWTQSADPSFAGYQVYQSSVRGQLGTLIGTNTDIADTSLDVTGLSPWTTYYFTLRILSANGAHVDYAQQIVTTEKAFYQQDWFGQVVFVAVIVGVAVIAIYVLYIRPKKRAKVT